MSLWTWWLNYSGPVSEPPTSELALDTEDDLEAEEFDGPLARIPTSRREVYKVYGDPSVGGKFDKKWARKNMHTAKGLSGTWNSGKGRLYCHNLAEPYIREALRRCDVLGVLGEIDRFGCFNFRHQRHDTSRPLSYHSWGIAVDINSADNKVRRYRRTKGFGPPEPFGDEWSLAWPNGVSELLVEAFEGVGFEWGGRWKTFVDPMHFQLVG